MIRLIQRRLIIPRGDTGKFTVPLIATTQTGDISVFTIFDQKIQRKIFEKIVEINGDTIDIIFSHAETVNLPVGNYVWDIKFYSNPVFADGALVDGIEVDSYYGAFTLPICEVRQTGDNLLTADDAPTSTISPDSLNIIAAAISEANSAKRESAASATSAANSVTEMAALVRAIPTKVSEFENDAGYLTQHQDISGKANSADLAAVATSGSYNDLLNKPFIPSAVSDLTDDSGHYTKPVGGIPAADLAETYLTSFTETDPTVPSWAKQPTKPSYTPQEVGSLPADTYIPQKTSDLTNDSNYVVDANYVHTDNNYTTAEKNKLSGIAAGAEVNVNADWNASSGDAQILNKPTKVSAFTNDAGYLTSFTETDPTVPSWAKAVNKPTYTAAEVGAPTVQEMNTAISTAIGNVHQFDIQIVQALPTENIQEHTIYFVPKTGETNDVYDEYIRVNNAWEMIGNTQIDLSNYVQKDQIATSTIAGLVKVDGSYGILINPTNGTIAPSGATNADIKTGTGLYRAIMPNKQHQAVFYGLAKAAGDTTQSQSDNAVGTYTTEAKTAILNMFGLQLATDTEIQNIINGGAGA